MVEVLISAYHSNTHWFCKFPDTAHTSLSLLPFYPGLPSALHMNRSLQNFCTYALQGYCVNFCICISWIVIIQRSPQTSTDGCVYKCLRSLGIFPLLSKTQFKWYFIWEAFDLTIPHCLTRTSSGTSFTVSHFPLVLLLSSKRLLLPEATLLIVCSPLYYLSFPLGFKLLESSVSLTAVTPMSKAMLRNLSTQYIFVKWSNKLVDTTTSTSSIERSITCLNYCSMRLAICNVMLRGRE